MYFLCICVLSFSLLPLKLLVAMNADGADGADGLEDKFLTEEYYQQYVAINSDGGSFFQNTSDPEESPAPSVIEIIPALAKTPPTARKLLDQGSPQKELLTEKQRKHLRENSGNFVFIRFQLYEDLRDEHFAQVITNSDIKIIRWNTLSESELFLTDFTAAFNQREKRRSFEEINFFCQETDPSKLLNFLRSIKNKIDVKRLIIQTNLTKWNETSEKEDKFNLIASTIAEILRNDALEVLEFRAPFNKSGWEVLGAAIATKVKLKGPRYIEIRNEEPYDEGIDKFLWLNEQQHNKNLTLKCHYLNKKNLSCVYELVNGSKKKK